MKPSEKEKFFKTYLNNLTNKVRRCAKGENDFPFSSADFKPTNTLKWHMLIISFQHTGNTPIITYTEQKGIQINQSCSTQQGLDVKVYKKIHKVQDSFLNQSQV